jgi:hypothetical protein
MDYSVYAYISINSRAVVAVLRGKAICKSRLFLNLSHLKTLLESISAAYNNTIRT